MINIAVCDDYREDTEQLCRKLEELWGGEADVDTFASGADLLEGLKEKDYQIIFLDIFLDKQSGIEIAEEIRQRRILAEIVLVSSSKEFGPEAFEIDALYYLLKPLEMDKLREVKTRFERKQKAADASVTLKVHGRDQEIPFSLLSYVESVHNNLQLYLKNGNMIQIRGSIQEFHDELDERFLRINRGVVVNMDSIDSMDSENCEISGYKFPISRRRRAECRRIYNNYLFNIATGKRN